MSTTSTPRSSRSQSEGVRYSAHSSFSAQSTGGGSRSSSQCESEKSAKKFFMNWRQACDKTKDRTKELLKRTLSWKDAPPLATDDGHVAEGELRSKQTHGWSVHVWTTWVKRSFEEQDVLETPINLSSIQKEKLQHFFVHLLDTDQDELICRRDFYHLSEKLRHFADWSETSFDFSMLQQVQNGFIDEFISNSESDKIFISINEWLQRWSSLLTPSCCFKDLPFWLQQLPRIIFSVINKNCTGIIAKDELNAFFVSVVGIQSVSEQEALQAYNALTANGDFLLNYEVYRLCFANWLFGHHSNGPGQWIFGKCGTLPDYFPVDYSALNTAPEDIEPYTVKKKSDRFSIIV